MQQYFFFLIGFIFLNTYLFFQLSKHPVINEMKGCYLMIYKNQNKNHFKTIYKCFEIYNSIIYIYIVQYLFRNSIMMDRHVYDIQYCINYRPYRFRICYKRGPSKFLQFINDKDEDISMQMFEYVGPNDDFHLISYTPNDFNLESLTINYTNGNVHTFSRYEVIV
jgi:hypothetical protein